MFGHWSTDLTLPMTDCAIEGVYPAPLGDANGENIPPDMTRGDVWWDCDMASEPIAAHALGAGRVITDDRGVCWTVVELHAASAADETAGCLAFVSANNARQVWSYPCRWRALRGADLKAVGWGRRSNTGFNHGGKDTLNQTGA